MSTHTSRRTAIIEAEDEQGRTYHIEEYTDFIETRVLSGPPQEVEGMKELLVNGQHVNSLGNGEYQVVATGMKLKAKQSR